MAFSVKAFLVNKSFPFTTRTYFFWPGENFIVFEFFSYWKGARDRDGTTNKAIYQLQIKPTDSYTLPTITAIKYSNLQTSNIVPNLQTETYRGYAIKSERATKKLTTPPHPQMCSACCMKLFKQAELKKNALLSLNLTAV